MKRGNTVLKEGDTFTQEDIDLNLISYQHNNIGTFSDYFKYDVIDAPGNWDPGHIFNILIIQPLVVTANAKNVSCYNGVDGEINILAQNGEPPYEYSIDGGLNFVAESNIKALKAGDYAVVVKDNLGGIFQIPVTITQPDSLLINYNFIDNNVYLSISGGTPPYQTSLDSVIFTSALEYLNLPNGLHNILILDANGCEKMIQINVTGVSTHSINSNIWKVFPVPTNEIIYIESSKANDFSASLFNVEGKLILKKIFTITKYNNTTEINLASFSNGIYWLHLTSKESNYITKLILQK